MTNQQPEERTPSNSEVDQSISAERALLLLFLLAGPIVFVEWVIFSLVWGQAALWNGLDVVLNLRIGVPLFIAGLLTHEFVHGPTWKLAGRVLWRYIRFGYQPKTFTRYAHVTTALSARAYRWGTVMPLLAVGLLPFLVGLAFAKPVWAAFGMVFTFVAGGISQYFGRCTACQKAQWCETILSALDATSPHNNGLQATLLRWCSATR